MLHLQSPLYITLEVSSKVAPRRQGARGAVFSGHIESYVKRALEIEQLPLCRGSIRGTGRGCFFSGGSEIYTKRVLEMEHLSVCRGSVRGTWKGGGLFWGLRELCKEGFGDRASSSM
jgi:hypothetical protein